MILWKNFIQQIKSSDVISDIVLVSSNQFNIDWAAQSKYNLFNSLDVESSVFIFQYLFYRNVVFPMTLHFYFSSLLMIKILNFECHKHSNACLLFDIINLTDLHSINGNWARPQNIQMKKKQYLLFVIVASHHLIASFINYFNRQNLKLIEMKRRKKICCGTCSSNIFFFVYIYLKCNFVFVYFMMFFFHITHSHSHYKVPNKCHSIHLTIFR